MLLELVPGRRRAIVDGIRVSGIIHIAHVDGASMARAALIGGALGTLMNLLLLGLIVLPLGDKGRGFFFLGMYFLSIPELVGGATFGAAFMAIGKGGRFAGAISGSILWTALTLPCLFAIAMAFMDSPALAWAWLAKEFVTGATIGYVVGGLAARQRITLIQPLPQSTDSPPFQRSRKWLIFTGYSAMANAILKVSICITFTPLVFPNVLQIHPMVEVMSAIVSAYIFWAYKKLLKGISDLPERIADIFVCLNICLAGVMFMSFTMNTLYTMTGGHAHASTGFIDLLELPIRLGLGITFLVFSFKLFLSRAGLFGLRKPLAWTAAVAGIGYGTMVLPPVALLGTAVLDILMGLVFFRAAQQGEPTRDVHSGA